MIFQNIFGLYLKHISVEDLLYVNHSGFISKQNRPKFFSSQFTISQEEKDNKNK